MAWICAIVEAMKSGAVQKHTLVLPIASIISKRRRPSVHILVSGRPNTVFFAGFGNEGSSLGRVLSLLKAQGIDDIAVVGPMPYWHIPAEESDLRALGITGVVAVASYLREHYDIPTLHVVAESQTAGALTHAASQHPDIFNGNVGLLRPLGLTTMTRKEFKAGLRAGLFHADQFFDWRAWPVGVVATWRVLQDRLRHGGKQFDLGISWDNRKELKKLYAVKPKQIRIFAAAGDRLYSVEAIQASLKASGIATNALEVIPGIHASPATRAGSLQVAHTIRWCKSDVAAA